MRRRLSAVLVLVSCAIAGCRERRPAVATDAGAVAIASSAPSPAAPIVHAGDASVPAGPSRETIALYTQALAAGRAASKASHVEEAVRQLTRALDAMPNDATALGERSLAELHAGDARAARVDLEHAIAVGGAPALAAQLHFNLGLLDEQEGKVDAARVAFAQSNRLHPTSAAKKKLAGAVTACPVAFDDTPRTATHAASWKDVLALLHLGVAPAENADGVWLVPDASDARLDAVVRVDDGFVVIPSVAERWTEGGFKCESRFPEVVVTNDRGVLQIASSIEVCTTGCDGSGELVNCSSNGGGTRHVVAFWSLKTLRSVLRASWDDPADGTAPSGLSVEDGVLRFPGCSIQRSLAQ